MKMRKLIALFSAVLMLCTLIPVGAITVTAAASDITTNFDNGSRNGWSGPTCSADAAYSGAYGVTATSTSAWGNLLKKSTVLNAHTAYKMTFWYKSNADAVTNAAFEMGYKDAAGTSLKVPLTNKGSTSVTLAATTSSWTQMELYFATGDYTSVDFKFYRGSGSAGDAASVCVDEIVLEEVSAETDGYIVDGGFESGTMNFTPNSKGTITSDAHTGSYAVTGTSATKYDIYAQKYVRTEKDTDYTFKFWAKSSGSGKDLRLYVNAKKFSSTSTNDLRGTYSTHKVNTSWAEYTVTFNSGSNTEVALSLCSSGSSSTFYLDDLTLIGPSSITPDEPDEPTVNPDPEIPVGNLFSNSTFENNNKSGWTLYGGSLPTTNAAKTGSYSLNGKGSGWNGIANITANVVAGKSYQLSFWYNIKVAGFNWKITGVTTGTKYSSYWQNTNLGTWQQVVVEFVADDSQVKFSLSGLDETSSPDFYIDDVYLVEVLGPSDDGFILNGDFEVGKTTGWNVHQNTKVSAGAANNSAYGINLIGNGGWGGMLDQAFKTTKGLKYVLTFDLKVNNYGVNMQVRNKADDANLASRWFALAQNGEWATYTFEFTAVSADTYLNFCGGGGGSSTGGENVYVDNIKIVEIPCEHVYDSIQDDECNVCGHIRPVDIVDIVVGGQTSTSEDANGLAFKFEIAATGAAVDNNNKYVAGSASVNPYGNDNGYTLVAMGSVITNKADKATEALLNLNTVNGKSIIKIEANYLLESDGDSLAFATRIIDIPDEGKDTTIYARSYYVFEKDGELIVIYDDIVAQSYNG